MLSACDLVITSMDTDLETGSKIMLEYICNNK